MKTKTKMILRVRRFFRRFNPWLFLICVLLAVVIWCVTMYTLDPTGLRAADDAVASVAAQIGAGCA